MFSVQQGDWTTEKVFLDQQVCLLQQQSKEKISQLEKNILSLEMEKKTLQETVVCISLIFGKLKKSSNLAFV